MPSLHPQPEAAFSRVHEEYERARPLYADAALDWAFAQLAIPPRTVLDLGAGTGKLTRSLVPRAGEVIALEPLAAMRGVLERELPGVRTLDGQAEAIPLADGSVDAVFAGQAFHWFRAQEAIGEAARVLRPQGSLVLVVNRVRRGEAAWFDAVRELMPRSSAAHPGSGWRELLALDERFDEPRTHGDPHDHRLPPDEVITYLRSHSSVAVLPPDEQSAALDRARALLAEHGLAGEQELVLPYTTEITIVRRG
jgi:SAM-dependent methyltransferase